MFTGSHQKSSGSQINFLLSHDLNQITIHLLLFLFLLLRHQKGHLACENLTLAFAIVFLGMHLLDPA